MLSRRCSPAFPFLPIRPISWVPALLSYGAYLIHIGSGPGKASFLRSGFRGQIINVEGIQKTHRPSWASTPTRTMQIQHAWRPTSFSFLFPLGCLSRSWKTTLEVVIPKSGHKAQESLINPREVAKHLAVSRSTVYCWFWEGKLRAWRSPEGR
jgi:excisionase family DNA binding protein